MLELFLSLLLFKPRNGTSEIRSFQVIARGLRVTHLHISCAAFGCLVARKCASRLSTRRRGIPLATPTAGHEGARQGAQQIGTTYDTNNPAVLNDRNPLYSMRRE
jgi:hypothetical protein